MLRTLYEPQELCKRSNTGQVFCKTPNGVHTRKQITATKRGIIDSTYNNNNYYYYNNMNYAVKVLQKQHSYFIVADVSSI